MGTKERREREKQELREKILAAALAIILKEGFASFSMRKLAERIEYSPASIYLHFKNREEIAQELSNQGFRQLLAVMSSAITGPSAPDALRALGRTCVAFGLENPEIYRLIFMGDSAYMTAAFDQRTNEDVGVKTYTLLMDLAQKLTQQAPVKMEPTTLADLIWTTLHGIISLRIACPGLRNTEPEILAAAATESLILGLGLGQR